MNERIRTLYKSCRPIEALASQEKFQSADVLLGTEVAKFAELIVRECSDLVMNDENAFDILKHFGVEE
jgi:hypothetical protein